MSRASGIAHWQRTHLQNKKSAVCALPLAFFLQRGEGRGVCESYVCRGSMKVELQVGDLLTRPDSNIETKSSNNTFK